MWINDQKFILKLVDATKELSYSVSSYDNLSMTKIAQHLIVLCRSQGEDDYLHDFAGAKILVTIR